MDDHELSERLARLPTAVNPRAYQAVLELPRQRSSRRRWAGASAVALAAAAASVLLIPRDPGIRARGVGEGMPVGIEALAEGAAGLRPLSDGDVVHAGERVVFRLDAGGPGELSIAESDGTPIWPVDGPWRVDAGRWFLGDPPLAWVADGEGPRTVEARLCDDRGDCSRASFTVTFAP